jgi:hypothetical protein
VSAVGQYVFAVARDLRRDDVEGVRGFHGAPLRLVDHAGLSAVVCDVDLDEFGEEPLKRNLEDLTWLEWVARGHNDVVWSVASGATCAPLRLVTVCSDEGSVRARVDALRADLEEVLDRVEGRREWSLKILVAHGSPVEAGSVSGPTSGSDYLRRKREESVRRRDIADDAVSAAREVHEAARSHAVASRQLPPQDPRLTGRSEPMVLNAAFLVEADEEDGFATAVREAAEPHTHVTVELQGPWPPYSFAVLG